jgi:hypothetical protein
MSKKVGATTASKVVPAVGSTTASKVVPAGKQQPKAP